MSDMADQYDDGRYDPGYAMDPGLRTLLEEPITVRRGGIQYRKKETPMPESVAKELADLRVEYVRMGNTIESLERKIKRGVEPPPANQHAWTIDVRFQEDGKLYNFLILRVNGMFYTTGTGDTAFFRTWLDLVRWLDTETVGHSALIPMSANYTLPSPLEGK